MVLTVLQAKKAKKAKKVRLLLSKQSDIEF